ERSYRTCIPCLSTRMDFTKPGNLSHVGFALPLGRGDLANRFAGGNTFAVWAPRIGVIAGAETCTFGRSRPPDLRRSLHHDRKQALAAAVHHLEEVAAHARLPELVDVLGHAIHTLVMRLR